MKITDITEQQKNKDRCNIFVDGKYAFGLHIQTIVKHQLKIGSELSEETIDRLKTDDAFRQAYDRAIDYLSRRPRSSHEVRQHLRNKLIYRHPDYIDLTNQSEKEAFIEVQQKNIDRIITQLQQKNYLNDSEFAKWWITNRRQFKPRGKRLLLLELKTKGVSNEDIHTALFTPSDEGHFSSERIEYSETEAAMQLATKRLSRLASHSPQVQKQKLSQYLAGKGFDWDVVNEVVGQLIQS